ncbi:hypothetical protein LX36DRAFT_650129 [Colletotrichum falcatum]|nr:hypothetical protein LX36DRAFT_650129 [Colletotrichum falcatum]
MGTPPTALCRCCISYATRESGRPDSRLQLALRAAERCCLRNRRSRLRCQPSNPKKRTPHIISRPDCILVKVVLAASAQVRSSDTTLTASGLVHTGLGEEGRRNVTEENTRTAKASTDSVHPILPQPRQEETATMSNITAPLSISHEKALLSHPYKSQLMSPTTLSNL